MSRRVVRPRSVPPGIVTREPQTGRERRRVWNAKCPRTCFRGSLTPCLRVWHPLSVPAGNTRRCRSCGAVARAAPEGRHELRDRAAHRASAGGCNFLVFGVGRDSVLWLWLNNTGRTVFLENSAGWAQSIAVCLPSAPIYLVRYGTRRTEWRMLLAASPSELELILPPPVTHTRWDVIFVDGPQGYDDHCPGRMKSIYTAYALGTSIGDVDVLIHDCDREVERTYCDRFFGGELIVRQFERTRHYRTRFGQNTSLPIGDIS